MSNVVGKNFLARSDLDSVLLEVQAKGFELSSFIIDGRNHRFKLDSRDNKRSGSYRAFRTKHGIEIQIYSFRDSEMQLRYRLTGERKLSEEEIREHETEIEARKKRQDLRATIVQETVAIESEAKFRQARGDDLHPLLARRCLHANYGGKVYGSLFLVPCRDIEGRLWSVQSLGYANGHKGYFPGGAKQKGCLHLIGEIGSGPIFITEGFITGASLHQLSRGQTVAVAFSANNLTEVALALRKKYPTAELIISGDRDDTGIKNSNKAAKLAKARVLIPDFGINHPEFKDWNDFYKQELEGGVPMAVEQLKNYRQKSQSGEFETWFMEWVDKNQLSMTYRGSFSFGESAQSYDFVQSKLFLDANQASRSFGKTHCKSAFTMWCEVEKEKIFQKIIAPIIGYEKNDELEKFVRSLTNYNVEQAIVVMRHFLWGAKRKMLGLAIDRPIMPVITGAQNSGKSQSVAKLASPIQELITYKTVQSICDEKQYPMFGDHFLIILDEMAKAEQSDNETLKYVITATELNTRKFREQHQLYIPNRASLIGTSNYPLDTILRDSTGMRRFYEIRALDRCDWATLNSIDYVNLWKGIDAKSECPLTAILTELGLEQETYRHKTDLEEFLEEINFEKGETPRTLISELRKLYDLWCVKHSYRVRTPQSFGLELKRLGYRNEHAGKARYFIRGWAPGIPQLPD